MGLIWWILPAVAGVVGLMLLFAGFGKLAKLKPLAGGSRMLFGVGFLGLAGIVAFAGLNLQTYKRLTFERDVANIKFVAVDGTSGDYLATVVLADGTVFQPTDGSELILSGNEFMMGADVIKFKPLANMLGYDSIYRLSFLSSIDTNQFNSTKVTTGQIDRIHFFPDEPGLSVKALAKSQGKTIGLEDATYGSATFNPMGDNYEYNISMTQDALVARATEATKLLQERDAYPGFQSTNGGPK